MAFPNPDSYDSWDSFEGIGDLPPRVHPNRAQAMLAWVGDRVPGVFLAACLAYLAERLAGALGRVLFGNGANPISGVPLAIALGIVLCNAVGIPGVFVEGLKACVRPIQKLAIMLLGWRLSLGAVGGIGLQSLPIVAVTISAALVVIPWLGVRSGLTRRLAALIAVGTSICGVSAIMAVAPVIEAEEGEVSYAVACVAIFGMLAMLVYPFAVPALLGTDAAAIGTFFGIAIHDTAQVTGAALAYQQGHHAPEVLNIATVVKILRNLSMAAVIPFVAWRFHSQSGRGPRKAATRTQFIPPFVLGFLGCTLARTLGDLSPRAFGILDHADWTRFLSFMDHSSTDLLTVVMAAVGLSTGLARIRKLGWRPFFVGLGAALVVGAVGLGMIRLVAALRA